MHSDPAPRSVRNSGRNLASLAQRGCAPGRTESSSSSIRRSLTSFARRKSLSCEKTTVVTRCESSASLLIAAAQYLCALRVCALRVQVAKMLSLTGVRTPREAAPRPRFTLGTAVGYSAQIGHPPTRRHALSARLHQCRRIRISVLSSYCARDGSSRAGDDCAHPLLKALGSAKAAAYVWVAALSLQAKASCCPGLQTNADPLSRGVLFVLQPSAPTLARRHCPRRPLAAHITIFQNVHRKAHPAQRSIHVQHCRYCSASGEDHTANSLTSRYVAVNVTTLTAAVRS